MENNALGSQIVRATLARLEADRQEALTTIQLYVNAVTGVADHPAVVTEVCTAAAKLAQAERSMEALDRLLVRSRPGTTDNED
tara:strand:- start:60064 stop:60312 length:249 start_codon:yes stop_codon:yes gene_type:complete